MGLYQTKKLLHSKKMKREPTEWENIFANDTYDKEVISKIGKELIWFNTKKTNNSYKKWTKDLNRHLFKRIYRWPTDMKKCSASLLIREMQFKNTMRYHLMPVRMATINKLTKNNCRWGCEEKGNLMHCWWECRLVPPLWKTVWSSSKIKNRTAFWPSDPTSGNLSKETWNTNFK